MENMDKIFGLPWLVWIILAVAMVVTVLSTELVKPLLDKIKCKIPGLILFWVIGILIFFGLSCIDWMKFGPVPVMVYIVIGGSINVSYYKDFLNLRTAIRKLIVGEVPIIDPPDIK